LEFGWVVETAEPMVNAMVVWKGFQEVVLTVVLKDLLLVEKRVDMMDFLTAVVMDVFVWVVLWAAAWAAGWEVKLDFEKVGRTAALMVVEMVVLKAIELVASWAAEMVFVQVALWGCYVVALMGSYSAVLMAAKRVSAMDFD
jgi:hypothetical protein